MQQIKIDELRLTDEELETDIRKDYENFRVRDETGYIQDMLIWTEEAQIKKLQRLANEKGRIIAFVPEGIIEIPYEGKCDTTFIFTSNIIRVEV